MKVFWTLFFILSSRVFAQAAEDDTCRVLDYPKVYPGITFKELDEIMDLSRISFYADEKKHQVIAYLFLDDSDINRLDFVFEVDKWKDKPVVVVPNDARLNYLMVSYNNDVMVEERLIAEYGAPALQTIPETGMIYNFDNQWKCISQEGKPVKVTHIHKRVTYELDKPDLK